jgi:hypothetical protein
LGGSGVCVAAAGAALCEDAHNVAPRHQRSINALTREPRLQIKAITQSPGPLSGEILGTFVQTKKRRNSVTRKAERPWFPGAQVTLAQSNSGHRHRWPRAGHAGQYTDAGHGHGNYAFKNIDVGNYALTIYRAGTLRRNRCLRSRSPRAKPAAWMQP